MKLTRLIEVEETIYIDLLKEKINKRNVFFFLNICKAFSLKTLCEYIMSVLKNNFITFSKTSNFNAFDYVTFQGIINSSELNVSNEIEVFEAIISWVSYDETNRKKFACDLLKTVRLPLLPTAVVETIVGNHPFWKNCRCCREHVEGVLVRKSSLVVATDPQFQNRWCANQYVPYMFASATKRVFFESDAGFTVEKLGSSRSALQVNDFAYRFDRFQRLKIISKYDKKWKQINLVEDQYAACFFMKKLYIVGGGELDKRLAMYDPLKKCHCYDPKTGRMRRIKRLREARFGHSCVVFNGRMVATGGCDNLKKSVEAYDHFEGEWTYMAGLTATRYHHGSVAAGNKLYVVGGTGCRKIHLRSCEVFDLRSKRFVRLVEPKLPLGGAPIRDAFGASGGKIVVRAGEGEVFVYDSNVGEWCSVVGVPEGIPLFPSVVRRY